MACNTNRQLCTPATVFVGVANPACGQFFNPDNFQAEQLIYEASFNDIINNLANAKTQEDLNKITKILDKLC